MTILFIGLVWAEPTSSAAGYRIMQLVELFLQQGMEVHFASAAAKSERTAVFPSEVIQHQIVLNDSSFDEFIQQLQPDIVLFDRYLTEEQYGWRVYQHCPNALTILDTEDLHFVRKAREEAYKKQSTPNYYSEIAKREIASILKSDISLMISPEEIKILKDFQSDKNTVYLPFIQDKRNEIKEKIDFSERNDFMFIGNFHHEPNFQTAVQLKKNYWNPIKKALPQAKLYIYGAYPTQKVWDLHNEKEGFIVRGAADSVSEVMQKHRVLLAPIPFGAGIKGKFFDAANNDLPWLTSSIGAEGMNISENYIADSVEDFTQKAINLYTNEHLWNEAVNWANDWKNHQFESKEFVQMFLEKIQTLLKDISQHRNQNFIGQILKHQQFSATKYMNLWIEEKSK